MSRLSQAFGTRVRFLRARVLRARLLRAQLLLAAVLASVAFASFGCGRGDAAGPPMAGGWHEFEGSWGASGSRKQLHLGEQRTSTVVEVSGSILFTGPSRPGVGFLGEAITFVDSTTGLVGRAVWTDEHGDQVFSELTAPSSASGTTISGRFIGGTGRYAGAEGGYEFRWSYLIDSEDGAVQGHTVAMKGRIRGGSSAPPAGTAPR